MQKVTFSNKFCESDKNSLTPTCLYPMNNPIMCLLCTGWVHCRLCSHYHHSCGWRNPLPVLLDYCPVPLDYWNYLPLHWFRPGLPHGPLCRPTLVQVGSQHCSDVGMQFNYFVTNICVSFFFFFEVMKPLVQYFIYCFMLRSGVEPSHWRRVSRTPSCAAPLSSCPSALLSWRSCLRSPSSTASSSWWWQSCLWEVSI